MNNKKFVQSVIKFRLFQTNDSSRFELRPSGRSKWTLTLYHALKSNKTDQWKLGEQGQVSRVTTRSKYLVKLPGNSQ